MFIQNKICRKNTKIHNPSICRNAELSPPMGTVLKKAKPLQKHIEQPTAEDDEQRHRAEKHADELPSHRLFQHGGLGY